MNYKKYFLASITLAYSSFVVAQDENNLVTNPGFEGIEGKLKKLGQIDKASNWISPTAVSADLFSASVKEAPNSVPQNDKGKEDARTGENYAGIVAYSYNNKENRTYIMAPLTDKLEKDVKYCYKMYVSLSDLSKYAVNNIGATFQKKAFSIDAKKDIVFTDGEAFVTNTRNKVYNARYNWEPICGEYTASGGEKFIVIGNFESNKNIRTSHRGK